jgi:hypothetical protein
MATPEGLWIRVSVNMPDDPKVVTLSATAFQLLITGWCWAKKHQTDGRISAKFWKKLGTPASRKELEDAGLVDFVDDLQWSFHGFLEWQESEEEVQAAKARRSKAGQIAGLASGLARRTNRERIVERFGNENELDRDRDLDKDIKPVFTGDLRALNLRANRDGR